MTPSSLMETWEPTLQWIPINPKSNALITRFKDWLSNKHINPARSWSETRHMAITHAWLGVPSKHRTWIPMKVTAGKEGLLHKQPFSQSMSPKTWSTWTTINRWRKGRWQLKRRRTIQTPLKCQIELTQCRNSLTKLMKIQGLHLKTKFKIWTKGVMLKRTNSCKRLQLTFKLLKTKTSWTVPDTTSSFRVVRTAICRKIRCKLQCTITTPFLSKMLTSNRARKTQIQ